MLSTIKSSPSTPNRKRRVSTRENHPNTPPLVTPSTHDENELEAEIVNRSSKARRQLSMPALKEKEGFDNISEEESKQVTKTCFGRVVTNDAAISHVQSNTRQVYALVNKMTGSIGGNGECKVMENIFITFMGSSDPSPLSFINSNLRIRFFFRSWRCNLW